MSFPYKYNYAQLARESGFQLRIFKDGPLDWRLMGSVEVERIVREQCLEQIDSVLNHLSEAPLGSILESNILDSGIAKYFLLSQFSIQYLLFCRKFLEETVAELRESHGAAQIEVASLKRSLVEANNEILQLNKRVTQMEAIHEVIYPCHLCTKNFVSNDALNLHITRKHSTHLNTKTDLQLPSAKDRENDISLINTIKLELEIKHLKERLNNAERKIKDGVTTPKSPKNRNECDKLVTNTVTHSIGIQSNLSETKERDEQTEDPSLSQWAETISHLHETLIGLNNWKEEQCRQHFEFLADINGKLRELTEVVEQQKPEQMVSAPESTKHVLNALLDRKMEEIGKFTLDRLSDVVKKFEVNYNDKLEELERELLKKSEPTRVSTQVNASTEEQEKSNNDVIVTDQPNQGKHPKVAYGNEDDKINKQRLLKTDNDATNTDSASDQETSSHSNQTFTKIKSENPDTHFDHKLDTDASTEESEEILDTVSQNIANSKELFFEGTINLSNSEHNKLEDKTNRKPQIVKKHDKLSVLKPKTVTRREAKRLLSSNLTDMGIDKQATYLTATSMKALANELSERRHKLKEKHQHFYPTRNRIKKFVDRLCSSKLPADVNALLNATKPQKPLKSSFKLGHMDYPISSDDEGTNLSEKTNNTAPQIPVHSGHNPEFKNRLESILASPIRIPEDIIKTKTRDEVTNRTPVPMPRKKVMFNRRDVNDTLSLSETESPS
ncbi:cilium assembly protein DZIP1L [Musca vetustissima]|uniref:cilium assembly protein DZIP1L n=1 Tax=Musca vetustissima TaxID=27455 RepID=UPI002AB67869|nr:cilium assembly protein DZIP1L [Musca vetustissima]